MDQFLSEDQLQSLFQYAMVLSENRQDAHDLLQSAIESYLIRLQRGKETIANPLAFVRALIRNRFIDHYRHSQRWQNESYEEMNVYDISPVCLEEITITGQELESLWSRLSVMERDILYHWAVLGYSTDEVCALFAIPRGTFLSKVHRLRQRFRNEGEIEPTGVQA
jgi:RNA polymerase sigma-70 factor (ECF subfamily)